MSISYFYAETLKSCGKDFISQVEMNETVANKFGYDYESVRGTVCKSVYPGIFSKRMQEYTGYKPVFRYFDQPAGFRKIEKTESIFRQSYDCENKDHVRTAIIDAVKKYSETRRKSIITFGGHEGLCVKRFIKSFPNSYILNIEKDEEVILEYQKLKLQSKDEIGEFSEIFCKYRNDQFDLINYDSHSYLCKSMAKNLELINNARNAKVLAVNMQDTSKFRNGGKWVREMNYIFESRSNPVRYALLSFLPEYKVVEEYPYRKENNDSFKSMEMRTYIFVRREK